MQVERVQTLTATAFTVGVRVKTQGSSRGDRREAWRRDKSRLEADNKRLKQRRGQESSRRRAAERRARRIQQLAVEALRRAKQISVLQTQELRAVLQGWPGDMSPGLVFGAIPGVLKVEAFMSRAAGKRGAIVLSFLSPESKATARASLQGTSFTLVDAYSRKSSSNAWHRIRTWHSLKDFENKIEERAEQMAEQFFQSMLESGLI